MPSVQDGRHKTHTLIPALPLVHAELREILPLPGPQFPTCKMGIRMAVVGAGRKWGRARDSPNVLGMASPPRALPGSSFHTPTCRRLTDWAQIPNQPPGPTVQFLAQFVGSCWFSAWGHRLDYLVCSSSFPPSAAPGACLVPLPSCPLLIHLPL